MVAGETPKKLGVKNGVFKNVPGAFSDGHRGKIIPAKHPNSIPAWFLLLILELFLVLLLK